MTASEPKTLLQIVGAKPEPAALSTATLVLIDMQDEYLPTGAVPLQGVEEAIEQGAVLLKRARQLGTPVLHVAHHGGKGFFDPESGAKINERVAPVENEPVVVKNHISAFVENPDTLTHLQKAGRKELIVIGFMTHMCVSTFVRAAVEQYGYSVTVVADCTASRALPRADTAGKVSAEDVHNANLSALSDFFACVVPTVEDIKDSR